MGIMKSRSKKDMPDEMEDESAPKKSLAVAYSMKRKGKKKMASGGEVSASSEKRPMPDDLSHDAEDAKRADKKKPLVEDDWTDMPTERQAAQGPSPMHKQPPVDRDAQARKMEDQEDDLMMSAAPRMAHGGMSMKPLSISEAIMAKRRAQKMADGGMVDLEENSEEMPNYYDELNEEAAGKEQYDDGQISAQPTDSNEHGDVLSDEDGYDMISRIRARMKGRRGY